MKLNDFYSAFGILLVYFTLIWQNSRERGIKAKEKAQVLIEKKATTASVQDKSDVRTEINSFLWSPLNLTIDIISLSGILAFGLLLYQNWSSLNWDVYSIVLISIATMHLVISLDLWRLNISLLSKLFKIKSL